MQASTFVNGKRVWPRCVPVLSRACRGEKAIDERNLQAGSDPLPNCLSVANKGAIMAALFTGGKYKADRDAKKRT